MRSSLALVPRSVVVLSILVTIGTALDCDQLSANSLTECHLDDLVLLQIAAEKSPPHKHKHESLELDADSHTIEELKAPDETLLKSEAPKAAFQSHPLPVDFLVDHTRLQSSSGSGLIATLRRNHAVAFIDPPRKRHFHFVHFFNNLLHQDDDPQPTPMSVEQHTMKLWTCGFMFSMLTLGLITWGFILYVSHFVEMPKDDELDSVRGRAAWSYMCPGILLLLSTACFFMTVSSVRMVNKDIIRNPVSEPYPGYANVTVTRSPITEPGKSGYEASVGVALSGVVACILTFAWRARGDVQVRMAVLGQYALRGATISAFIAMFLEIIGGAVLASSGFVEQGLSLGNLLMMIIVGVSEEGGKLTAVLLGTWISAVALKQAAPSCCVCTRLLIESPRALILAGFSAGFGFMIIENVEYVMAVASTPPTHYSSDDQEDEGANALMVISIFTICVRVLLNLHPWLTGWSAARLANLVFSEARDTAIPTFGELLWCIAPPAAAHAAFDFLVGGPGIIALFMPLTFWLMARWSFMKEWELAPTWTLDAKNKGLLAESPVSM